jgi:hypothetical protein
MLLDLDGDVLGDLLVPDTDPALLGATTRAEAEAALGAIRQDLLSGGL